jgi:plasmid stabilization system protein ParE
MTYIVVFSPEAQAQLVELYLYIADAASPAVAARYADDLVSYCESLRTFPLRGLGRDDIRPGLRITNFRRRTVIAFAVNGAKVAILGIFHGGQDYESFLLDDEREGG